MSWWCSGGRGAGCSLNQWRREDSSGEVSRFGSVGSLTGVRDTERVLLAGASGVLGRHLTAALTAAQYEVISLGRGAGNDVSADLCDHEGLLRAVDGWQASVVIHAATALRKPPMRYRDMAATNALRVVGTANLLAAAREIGARRFVAETMVFGYGFGDFGPREVTEEDPYGPAGRTARLEEIVSALRTKEELTFTAEGIEGVALRYGLFYGAGGTGAIVAMLRKRMLPVVDERRVLPWVNLTDAATATVAAVRHGRAGQAYNVVDDMPTGFAAHVRAVAEAFGTPRPLTVPLWLMRTMPYVHTMMTTDMRVSNAKARRELGWVPAHPSCAEGLRDLAASSDPSAV